MASAVEDDPNVVSFVAGGFRQSRPVRTGADAKPTFEEIPTVDFSTINGDAAARKKLAEAVSKVASEVGFFYAANTPVSPEIMDEAFAVIKQFFGQPEEEKLKIHINKSPAAKGYQSMLSPDGKHIIRSNFGMGNDYLEEEQHFIKVAPEGSVPLNQWPPALPQFRTTLYKYYSEVYAFAKQLVQIFALALGLEETALDHMFVAPLNDITIQHYPALPNVTEKVVPLFAHADHSVFTLLLQNDVPGLEVLNANGIWIPCPPKKHTYTINTGNYLEAWSNGRLPSTVHRVTTTVRLLDLAVIQSDPNSIGDQNGKERVSLPYFLSPDPSVTVVPLEEIMASGETPKFSPHPIGPRHVKGMMSGRPTHPFVLAMKEKGVPEEDYVYEMLSQPALSEMLSQLTLTV